MIDQQDYQLLKTIGEQGSVQRAASAIGVSWPSVSKRLAKIEGKLNVQLFERRRGRNGVLPLPVLSRLLELLGNSFWTGFQRSVAVIPEGSDGLLLYTQQVFDCMNAALRAAAALQGSIMQFKAVPTSM